MGIIIAALVMCALMLLLAKGNEGEEQFFISADHLEGLYGCPYNENLSLSIKKNDGYLEICIPNKEKVRLLFTQIVQVNFIPWEKTITKELNPLAEGIVGGVLGGSTMAVVSAIDAKGKTRSEKVKIKDAIEILYHPKGDIQSTRKLIVHSRYLPIDTEKWADTICKYANLPEPQYITPQPKGPTYL